VGTEGLRDEVPRFVHLDSADCALRRFDQSCDPTDDRSTQAFDLEPSRAAINQPRSERLALTGGPAPGSARLPDTWSGRRENRYYAHLAARGHAAGVS
jgi:hypothetical protein